MAKRNWKKIGRLVWLKQGKKTNIRGIRFVSDKMLIIDKNTAGNYNIILGKGNTGVRTLLSTKATKLEALKFAKTYMKKH